MRVPLRPSVRAGLRAVLGRRFLLPNASQRVPVACAAQAPRLTRGDPLKVLVWNVQFCGGREQVFFHDGGRTVAIDRDAVEVTLEGIRDLIRAEDPDFVLLQEVDRGSRRTAFVDQHAWLVQALELPCHASTAYWRAPYVPIPRHEPLGRVETHLSVLSRFQITHATRHALPLLVENPLRQLFNLKRAVLEVALPFEGGGELRLLNTHLSAFSKGDGTLTRQIAVLDTHLTGLEAQGLPWVLAGDFNTLPPGDDATRLPPAQRAEYPERTSPIEPLLAKWGDPVGRGWREDPEAWRTYLPVGSNRPDRTLDYVLHGAAVRPHAHRVVRDDPRLSDHLPLLFTFA